MVRVVGFARARHVSGRRCRRGEGALAAVDLVISDIDRALERWTWGGWGGCGGGHGLEVSCGFGGGGEDVGN